MCSKGSTPPPNNKWLRWFLVEPAGTRPAEQGPSRPRRRRATRCASGLSSRSQRVLHQQKKHVLELVSDMSLNWCVPLLRRPSPAAEPPRVCAQTSSIVSFCIVWLHVCRWNRSRTRVPPTRFGTRTASVDPSVWQELMVRRYGNCVLRGLGGARPKAGQGRVDLGAFAQTGSIPSFCIVWLSLCRWNPTRTHVCLHLCRWYRSRARIPPTRFGTKTTSVNPSVWQELMVRRCGNSVLRVLCGARPKAGQGEVALGVFSQTGSVPSSCILWLNLCRWTPTRTHVPPSQIRRNFFPTARLDFRRPIRLAGADGAPLQQLRDSRASRRKARSRSRPGRPWRFCPDQLNPFLLYCLVESVQLEPKRRPIRLATT